MFSNPWNLKTAFPFLKSFYNRSAYVIVLPSVSCYCPKFHFRDEEIETQRIQENMPQK